MRVLLNKMWYIIYKTNEEGNTMRKELLKGLSEEQIKKVEACKSPEEILNLAKAEGVELNEEQLEAVSGGGCNISTDKCPECGSKKVKRVKDLERSKYECLECGNVYIKKLF